MTSLILKLLRPIVVPLIVEAMEQHDKQQARRIQRHIGGQIGMVRTSNGGGPARY